VGIEIIDWRNQEVWGTEVHHRGPGAEPPEADDIFLIITIANIVSCDHCVKLDVAILAEWIKIMSTMSVFSFSTFLHATPTDDWGSPVPTRKRATAGQDITGYPS